MRVKSGFTLVEILIMAVVLGILAAIVIPQFSRAGTKAKESSLMSNLQAVRSQIELYKIQHNDNLPGTQGTVDFVAAMTSKTNRDGEVGTTAAHKFGPYMQSIPVNPFNDLNTVELNGTAGDDTAGWNFVTTGVDADADACLFQADDSKVNPVDGSAHTTY